MLTILLNKSQNLLFSLDISEKEKNTEKSHKKKGASHICKNTFFSYIFPIPYSILPVVCCLKAINFWLYSKLRCTQKKGINLRIKEEKFKISQR
ncbi:hypothetical protein D5R40_28695 [Okeania hirsuta]|uniref:Uncharacterized protein n=1 Tax=Okeania hirsuta TaxID=1458930 RepID=A0A3N6PVD5_9CYAN|nr:hypothetical protein D4Z78_30225 [Okeania hirsuta]RQH26042.1 hypothetical protein D5R40_28695 [Okeania hirsuta]